jgi:hypothetical protein
LRITAFHAGGEPAGVEETVVRSALLAGELLHRPDEPAGVGERWKARMNAVRNEQLAEIVVAGAVGPEGGVLLSDDHGLAGLDGQAGQESAVLAAGQEESKESRFAGFPQAGQQRQVTPGNETVPELIGGGAGD